MRVWFVVETSVVVVEYHSPLDNRIERASDTYCLSVLKKPVGDGKRRAISRC